MGRLILITGGARSGKSSFAVETAKRLGGKVAFVATCEPRDDEMGARVREHAKKRPPEWSTVVEERDVAFVLRELEGDCNVAVVDCITLLVSNLLLAGKSDEEVIREVRAIADAAGRAGFTTIVVSNEVGSGVVPENRLGRRFRDVAGTANQVVAGRADEVFLTVSGLPLKIKGD